MPGKSTIFARVSLLLTFWSAVRFLLRSPHQLLLFHVFLGLALVIVPSVSALWALFITGWGLLQILINRDANHEAAFYTAYLAGFDLMLRATSASPVWEYSKIVCLLMLGIGVFFRHRQQFPFVFLLFILFFLPSIPLVEDLLGRYDTAFGFLRRSVSGSLGGPFLLAVSVIYFFDRRIGFYDYQQLLVLIPATAVSTAVYITLATPDLSTIEYDLNSNFATTTYGPNQVATVLGLSTIIMLIRVLVQFRQLLWWQIFLELSLAGLMLLRALVTFSRGGNLAALIAFLGFIMTMVLYNQRIGISRGQLLRALVLGFVILCGTFLYANQLTGNLLFLRYQGESNRSQRAVYNADQYKNYTTGRVEIALRDVQVFLENPLLGIGPGMSTSVAEVSSTNSSKETAHNEYTRLLAEHGIFGLANLLIVLSFPVYAFFWLPKHQRPYLVAFMLLALLSMSHAATRLASMTYLYGFALLQFAPFQQASPNSVVRDSLYWQRFKSARLYPNFRRDLGAPSGR